MWLLLIMNYVLSAILWSQLTKSYLITDTDENDRLYFTGM